MYKSKLNYSTSNRIKISFKTSPGSLITIDTIISLINLSNSEQYLYSVNLQSVNKFIGVISKLNLDEVKNGLKSYTITLRGEAQAVVINPLQNLFNQNKSTLPGTLGKENLFALYLGYENFENLLKVLDKVFKETITSLNNILGA